MLPNMNKIMLPRLQIRFQNLINDYKEVHHTTQKELAHLVGIPDSHLSNLMTGTRILSANYVFKFILKGVLRMKDIYDGKYEGRREMEFWEVCELCENIPLLKKFNTAMKAGLDLERYVDGYLQGLDGKKKP